jgi:hypothetical protein
MNGTKTPIQTTQRTELLVPHLMLPAPFPVTVKPLRQPGMATLKLNHTDRESAAVFSRIDTREGGMK